MHEEYQTTHNDAWSSKAMQQIIRVKVTFIWDMSYHVCNDMYHVNVSYIMRHVYDVSYCILIHDLGTKTGTLSTSLCSSSS